MSHYTTMDAGIVWGYIERYPDLMHQIAVELGYHNPPLGIPLEDADSEEQWFDKLLGLYWLADQPVTSRNGARAAKIWVKTAGHSCQSTGDLVDLIQLRLSERREAGIV